MEQIMTDMAIAGTAPASAQFFGDYLTERECAEGLGVSRRTLQRWHRLRFGPPRTLVGKRVRYRASSVSQWLREQEREVGE